ncbi:MAG: hypothetical protein AB1515_07860 [Nitrospirota bacterium]
MLGRGNRQAGLAAFLALIALWALAGETAANPEAAPKPLRLAIHDLLSEPERYDGRRVLVTGFVRSVEFQRGRRGSEYLLFVLDESPASPKTGLPTLTVVSLNALNVRVGSRVVVEGVYHREGKQAGRPYEFFIDAEEIRHESAV